MRRVLPIIATLAVLYGLIRLFRIAQQYDPSLARNGGNENVDVAIRLTDAKFISRDQGRPQWTMRADHVELHPLPYGGLETFRSVDFGGIHDGALFREGKQEVTFSASRATFNQASQQFDISGGLRLKTRKGDSMQAQECIWSEKDDFVRLPRGGSGVFNGYTLKAPFLLYEPKQRVVQCPQGGEAMRRGESLRASTIMWDIPSGHVHLTGPVSGTRGALSYQAQSAFMDVKNNTLHANNCVARVRIEDVDEPLEGLR